MNESAQASRGKSAARPVPGKERLEKIARSAGSREGSAYQGAMEAVFAILIATAIGYFADEYFDTAPRYLVIGAIIGFGSFVLRLLRMRDLIEDPMAPPIDVDAMREERRKDAGGEPSDRSPESESDDPKPFGLLGEDDEPTEDRNR